MKLFLYSNAISNVANNLSSNSFNLNDYGNMKSQLKQINDVYNIDDLDIVLVHEIGHALFAPGHSDNVYDVMNQKSKKKKLSKR